MHAYGVSTGHWRGLLLKNRPHEALLHFGAARALRPANALFLAEYARCKRECGPKPGCRGGERKLLGKCVRLAARALGMAQKSRECVKQVASDDSRQICARCQHKPLNYTAKAVLVPGPEEDESRNARQTHDTLTHLTCSANRAGNRPDVESLALPRQYTTRWTLRNENFKAWRTVWASSKPTSPPPAKRAPSSLCSGSRRRPRPPKWSPGSFSR